MVMLMENEKFPRNHPGADCLCCWLSGGGRDYQNTWDLIAALYFSSNLRGLFHSAGEIASLST